MRLAISNIAWEPHDDEAVSMLLKEHGVTAIDVAPGKYFARPAQVESGEAERVRLWWEQRGIMIVGMQSLLFGTQGLNLFGSREVRETMLEYLGGVCRTASLLGVQALTFGSPRNRDRSGLDDEQTAVLSIPFFRHLGDLAQRHGVTVCLEPNPEVYGSNYMTHTGETHAVVREVDHPAIRLQLDTGAMAIQEEDVEATIRQVADVVGHIHASEPHLVTLGAGGVHHAHIAAILRTVLPERTVTIEMLPSKDEDRLTALKRALHAADVYRTAPPAGPFA